MYKHCSIHFVRDDDPGCDSLPMSVAEVSLPHTLPSTSAGGSSPLWLAHSSL